MATEFALIRTQAPLAGGLQNITSPLITDFSAAIGFIFGHSGDGGTPTAHGRMCVGICTKNVSATAGVAEASCTASRARNAVTTTLNRTGASAGTNPRFLIVVSPSANAPIAACRVIDRATSGLANGIRLDWTTTPDTAYEMVILLIGGLSGVSIKPIAATTTPGFQTDFAVLLSTRGSFGGTDGSYGNDAEPNLGFLIRSGLKQVCVVSNWLTGVTTTDADGVAENDRCHGQIVAGVSTFATATAIGATTVTFTTNSIAAEGLFCKFADTAQVGVALETIPGATGTQAYTGLGFAPSVVLGLATAVNATNTTTDGASAATQSFFASTTSSEFSGGARIKEGVAINGGTPSATDSLFETKALMLLNDSGAVATRATRAANTASGWQLTYSLAAAGRMAVLGFAPGNLSSATSDTEQLSDQFRSILHRKLVLGDTESLSDGLVGPALADGLSALGPAGAVLQQSPERGTVLEEGGLAGETV